MERVRREAEAFLAPLEGRLGGLGRANGTFWAYRVMSTAMERIRMDVLERGARLTDEGWLFVARGAAYLATLAADGWARRGLGVVADVHIDGGGADRILVTASRRRAVEEESYSHDFARDARDRLVHPPRDFPWIHGQVYVVTSLQLPTPEYIYMYGAALLQSPLSDGKWPRTQKVGGLPEDFEASKQLLVDDLHEDCGIPKDDEALRELSRWVVFPPYGWQMNDGQDYNMMTLFDQIGDRVPKEDGVAYLRALLKSQATEIRNLAARCLMVYRQEPRDALESHHYNQALSSWDHDVASYSMAKYQHQMEEVDPTPEWRAQAEAERRQWIEQTPPPGTARTPVESDPDYQALTKLAPDSDAQALQGLERLMRKYPEDWFLKYLHASVSMRTVDPRGGEATMRELIRDPEDCAEAHLRLGTQLKHQGRREEAMEVFEDAVRRWPFYHQCVASCTWLVTDGMVTE